RPAPIPDREPLLGPQAQPLRFEENLESERAQLEGAEGVLDAPRSGQPGLGERADAVQQRRRAVAPDRDDVGVEPRRRIAVEPEPRGEDGPASVRAAERVAPGRIVGGRRSGRQARHSVLREARAAAGPPRERAPSGSGAAVASISQTSVPQSSRLAGSGQGTLASEGLLYG